MNDSHLRSPYTAEEFAAIKTALAAERARRKDAPFPQSEQAAIVRETVRRFREPAE